MPPPLYASLHDLREAIAKRRVIRFLYKGTILLAEPHLLGHAARTRALVLESWVRGENEGWRRFRFNEIRDLVVTEEHFPVRSDFTTQQQKILGIDTYCR